MAVLAAAAGLGLAVLLLAGCASSGESRTPAPATLTWQLPDSTYAIFAPTDLSAASTVRLWAVDTALNAVLDFDLARERYFMAGARDDPPEQVERPFRIAADPQLGVFVYDRGPTGADSGRVDLYSPEMQHLRSFPMAELPAAMAITHRPLGLAFALVQWSKADSAARLTIVRRNLRGESADTLLDALHGPPSLRTIDARVGTGYLAPAEDGFWLWSSSVPDTVFDVGAPTRPRTVALTPAEGRVSGLLCDRDRDVLWVLYADSATYRVDGYGYGKGSPPGHAPLASHSLPRSFVPRDAVDGQLVGWILKSRGGFAAAEYRVGPESDEDAP